MPTPVVGDCADCIVALPQTPPNALKLETYVSTGNKLVIQRVGTFTGYYTSSQAPMVHTGPMAPGSSYSVPSPVAGLFIATDQPLSVTVTKASVSMTFNVNRLLILDDTYDSFSVTNSSLATKSANATISYVAP